MPRRTAPTTGLSAVRRCCGCALLAGAVTLTAAARRASAQPARLAPDAGADALPDSVPRPASSAPRADSLAPADTLRSGRAPAPASAGGSLDQLRERLDRRGLRWAGKLLADSTRRDTTRADSDRVDSVRIDSLRVDSLRVDSAGGETTVVRQRRPPVACSGQRVNDIVVLAQPPYAGGLLARLEFVENIVRDMHATTREKVVRRFLLLDVGDACDELRRTESERILRAQPYLVDARITAYEDQQGGVTLEVQTRDEFSLVVGLSVRTAAPPVTAFRLGETNLAGQAINLTGEWYDGGVGYRDAGGIHLRDYQFLGRPYQLGLQAVRREVGGWWQTQLALPFYTDLQRFAWRLSAGRADEYIEFRRPDTDDRDALGVSRRYSDVGGVMRLGAPGRLSLFGVSLSMEEQVPGARYVQLSDTGVVDTPSPGGVPPQDRYSGQHVARLNALWGIRNMRFLRVVGFDALTGVQDVQRGFQLGTIFGRSLGILGSKDDDIHLSVDASVGMGSQSSFLAVQMYGEGRQDYDRNRWDGIAATGRGVWYIVPHERHRVITEVQYGGGWRERVPYQLALGDRWGGVRGYRNSREGGGRRLVARSEYRLVLGRFFGLGDFGAGAFVDAGKLWAGDVPYGVTSPVRSAAGFSLLASLPPRSRRMWRLDVAFPVQKEAANGKSWEVRFSNRDLTRLFFRQPDDVRMMRERAIPESVFSWP